jgi:hypothetical protein
MTRHDLRGLTRRQLLSRSLSAGALAVVGTGFIAAPNAAWAVEVTVITPEEMATLLQMARDIYPHDQVADQFYAVAVKGYDSEDHKTLVVRGRGRAGRCRQGCRLRQLSRDRLGRGPGQALAGDRGTPFFQTVRSGLVTGLYNQKEVWPIFGYQGESFSPRVAISSAASTTSTGFEGRDGHGCDV